MKLMDVIHALDKMTKLGLYVFRADQFRKFFPQDSPRAYQAGIQRAVENGLLVRGAQGVLVNPRSPVFGAYTLEWIAVSLRPYHVNYLSLESVLSAHGVISQILMDRITVMSTGRSAEVETPYGVIEYTHTQRSIANIAQSVVFDDRSPLRIATLDTALRDLRRVGRNTHLIDDDVISEIKEEMGLLV